MYGKDYSGDVARRMAYGSYKTLQLMEQESERSMTGSELGELDLKRIELKKEQQRFYDQRNAFQKLVRERSRQEELNDLLTDAVSKSELPTLRYSPSPIIHSDNDLLVSLNDIHYGAVVNNAWNTYDSDVCEDMLKDYLDRIIEISARHHSEDCICWMNGDAISGNIHYSIAVTNKENVIQQVMGVSELIAEFLAELSAHFSNVYFVSVAGNHSRINPNKDNTLLDERLDDLIEWYCAARLQDFANIHFTYDKIDPTMYAINIRGKTYVGVHGDYENTQSNIQTLQTMVGRPVYAVLLGHKHHNAIDNVQGIKTVMAGSFLGMDDYCIKKRIFGRQEQLVCVCDESGISCYYNIDLSQPRTDF